MPTKIINVSNRLPVTVGETISRSSGGLVAALEGVSAERYELRWIGWPGGEIADPDRQREVEQTLLREYGYTPVFLSGAEAEGFYEGFSNSSVWPLLHYMPSYMRYEAGWWDAYVAVNQRFADAVLKQANEGDLVWVHDYQLLLMPELLKRAMPSLKIGLFLHTPFPSYEVFRRHPRRTELLQGMLGADLIGFHTFGYLRHFRSAVLRLLGVESELTRIPHDGRVSQLGVFPIGINGPKFEEELKSDAFRQRLAELKETYRGKRVVLSVERMDYTKGILRRLDAVDAFLHDLDDRDGIKFVFVSIPSREGVEEYKELREDVEAQVGRLNGRYSTLNNTPIHFIHGSVPFTDLCAMYALAEVAVVTPLMDGMNLVAKEYVACQAAEPGVLVLSEFAGAAEELFNGIIVNPYDPPAVAGALRQALNMPATERRARMESMRDRVMKFDAGWWAGAFLEELQNTPAASDTPSDIREAGERITAAVESDKRIALFLDYDGTLREIERDPAAAGPTPAVRGLLEALTELPIVNVTIISGRTANDLSAWLGDYPFALIAEHGAALRRTRSSDWDLLDRNASFAWKDELLKILRIYVGSTPGSFIENKRTSLVWHYRKADPEFGNWKANQLVAELAAFIANQPLEVRHGRKIVEIAPTDISKGAAVKHLLEQQTYDLIVCAGDDVTDESMFRLNVENLVSIKVGMGNTQAQFRIATPGRFRAFLEEAMKLSPRLQRQ